ncbi:AhpA/YtjB family protein [Marinomonas lutimaris]|uniref:AhpA/YtjB family protein n=1 Tax=Marinomonas lutimaris TaxID=2846746 RepID=UPI001CA4F82D|nr:AhpA/YtjB family protein [Marinomonas lutimaris]
MDTQSKTKAIAAFIRKKLSASVITVATFISLMILTVCIFWYTMTHALGNYLSQQTEVLGSSLATQAAFNATQSILNNDLLSLNVLLNRLVVDDNILSARVYNKKDELLAEADSGNSGMQSEQDFRPSETHRVYSSSIKFRDEIVGHVLITLDKTPAQATLQHLNNLLIGVAIFTCTIALLLIILITKWLFAPINEASSALIHYSKGRKPNDLPVPAYKEAKALFQAVETIQSIERPKEAIEQPVKTEETISPVVKPQFEINFDAIFEESRQRSCVLYFDILNLEEWHKDMTPLQVANLLTPIYRAIFQASEVYLGQVHQYKNDSAIVLFSAHNSEDNLYINAVSTAQLFLGLVDKLLENELYTDIPKLNFHLGMHQGNIQVTNMVKENRFEPDKIENLLSNIHQLSESESINKLVISDDIFTLSHIQNRVFTGLPEVIEDNGKEILAYEVKGMSDKYKQQIHQHILEITNPEEQEDNGL